MYNVTTTFLNKITQNSRKVSGKLLLGTLELTDEDIISMDMEYSLGNDSIPAIGGVVASRLEVKLFRDKLPTVITTQELKPSLGLETSPGIIEYIQMGVFRVSPQDIVKTDKTIRLIAYDTLFILEDSPYITDLVFPATLAQIKADLTSKGLKFKTQSLTNITIKEKPNTIRELLSDIGELLGMNVVSNRLGEIEFRKLTTTTFSTDNYNSFKLLADDQVKLTRLTVEKEENNLTYGNDTGFTIKIKNDSITTESELISVYNRVFPISYIAYECNLQGLPHMDVGDIISLTDRHGVVRNIPIGYHKISYSGGLKSEIRANAPSGAVSSTGSTGSNSITQSLNDLKVNILEVNHLLADKISVNELEANMIAVNELIAAKATIADLEVAIGKIGTLEVGYADIEVLNANLADINTLLAGNLDANNLKAGLITATSGLIANLAITNAMIKNMNADKITAGKIKTNLVEIGSESGNFIIADNTLQIQDGSRVRVQIGKDASGDYSLSLWDIAGKLMFDARGLTEDAIKDEIIRNDMIATDANISADKIDIGSVVRSINNGVTKLESSSILYDGKSLNVAFNEFETNFNNLEIGARNLVRNSDFSNGDMYWIRQSGTMQYSENSLIFTGASSIYQPDVMAQDSASGYTLSVLARGVGSLVTRAGGGSSITQEITSDSEFKWYISNIPNRGNTNLILGTGSGTATIEIQRVQLERGNKSTDWTLAPEDIKDDIKARVKTTDFEIEQGKISTLISDVEMVERNKHNLIPLSPTFWEIGTLDASNGNNYPATIRLRTIGYIRIKDEVEYKLSSGVTDEGWSINIGYYTNDKVFIGVGDWMTDSVFITPETCGYARLTLRCDVTSDNLTPTDIRGRGFILEENIANQLKSTRSKLSTLEQDVDGFELTVSNLETEIRDIEVGGRNLILNSLINHGAVLNQNSGGMGGDSNFHSWVEYIEVLEDTNYTFSGLPYVRQTRVCYYTQDKAFISGFLNGKSLASLTFRTPSNAKYVKLSSDNGTTGTGALTKTWKLEKGNKSTDWTPAPEDTQAELDSKSSTWFYAVPPTPTNAPANTWATNAEKDKHINDLYTDTITGYVYRFIKTGSVYSWAKLTDKDLVDARTRLAEAEGTVSTTASNLATLTLNTNNFKTEVSTIYTTKTEFQNLDIGGRNFFQNSDFRFGFNVYWGIMNSSASGRFSLEGGFLKVVKDTGYSDFGQNFFIPAHNFENTDNLVFTAWVKGAGTFTIRFGGSSTKVVSIDTQVVEKHIFDVPKSRYGNGHLIISTTAGTIYFEKVKAEKGNKSTDWTPAPEDIDTTITQEINSAKQSIIEQTDSAIALKANKTDVYTKTQADGAIDTKINTAKGEIKVTTDAISSRVTTTETDTSGLKTRMGTAESKITSSAIVNTVESSSTKFANKIDLDGKEESIFKQSSAPPHKLGRMWLNISSTPEILYRSNGSTWYRCSPTSASDLGINLSNYASKSEVTQSANDVRFEFTNLKTPYGGNMSIQSGNTTISMNGVKVTHGSSTQYSEIMADGFVRKYAYGDAHYTNSLYIETVVTADPGYITGTPPGAKIIYIPKSFAYQNINNIVIVPVIKHFLLSWRYQGGASNDAVRTRHWEPVVSITPYLDTSSPYLYVTGWIKEVSFGSSGYGATAYSGLEVAILLLIGKGAV